MPHAHPIRRRLDRPSRRQASDDWPGHPVDQPTHPFEKEPLMRRTRTIIRPLLVALALVAVLAPAASASGGPFTFPPASGATGDQPGVTVAVVLAVACLLLGASTVLPS